MFVRDRKLPSVDHAESGKRRLLGAVRCAEWSVNFAFGKPPAHEAEIPLVGIGGPPLLQDAGVFGGEREEQHSGSGAIQAVNRVHFPIKLFAQGVDAAPSGVDIVPVLRWMHMKPRRLVYCRNERVLIENSQFHVVFRCV